MKHILLAGQPKTGTTGVYETIKHGLRPMAGECYFLFEPRTEAQITAIMDGDPSLSVVSKMMLSEIQASGLDVTRFDRRAVTVRDPRDRLISELLFKPLIRRTAEAVPMAEHERFLAALEEKERDPASWSVTSLLGLARDVGYKGTRIQGRERELAGLIDFVRDGAFHRVRYEEFVDGHVDELAAYLGIPLAADDVRGATWLTHISRSRSYGAWRHWFVPADVATFRPIFDRYLAAMGYPDEWELAADPEIDPATSSEHVRANLAKRRDELGTFRRAAAGDDADELDGADLRSIWEQADDGSAAACVVLARRLAAGTGLDQPWPESARYWARRASLQGSRDGRVLLRQLDRRDGARPARARSGGPAPVAAEPAPAEASAPSALSRAADAASAVLARGWRLARRTASAARRWVSARTGSGTGTPPPTRRGRAR